MGDTPGVKNAKSKTATTSVPHLAMIEDQIAKIVYIDHYLLFTGGGFSGVKLLKTQGERCRFYVNAVEGK